MDTRSSANNQNKPHKPPNVPGFDQTMKKLVEIPKENVEKREQAFHTPKPEKAE